jgi:hypothetical protein
MVHGRLRPTRRVGLLAFVALIGATTLAACGSGTNAATTYGGASASTADPGSTVVAPGGWGHVHSIALDGTRLLLGTHDGLWQQLAGQTPTQLSSTTFDVMGLAVSGGTLLASGHPPEGSSAPADLGLIISTDGGQSWAEVSLGGMVDFHRLVASGDVVTGISASDDTLIRSDDAGQAWTDLAKSTLFDLAIDPKDPSGAPLMALLAWTDAGIYGAGVSGRIYASTDSGQTWTPAGTVGAQPEAFAAEGSTVVAVVGTKVVESNDGGASFTDRVTGIS